MAKYQTEVRVRYADTDQGGVVYNANYLVFFEVGRTEMMREMGVPYAELEAQGLIMPVVESHINYVAPARYDDLLEIRSEITTIRRVRLRIDTEVFMKDSGQLLARGWVWLAATDGQGKVLPLPQSLRQLKLGDKLGN